MGAPVLQTTSVGFPAQFASKIENMASNNQGDNVYVSVPVLAGAVANITATTFAGGVLTVTAVNSFVPGTSVSLAATNETFLNGQTFSVATAGPASFTITYPFSFVLTSVATGTGVYTGTITGGAANAYAGFTFLVAGFTTAANNGSFLCTASTATTLTLSNGASVSETHAATAVGSRVLTADTGTATAATTSDLLVAVAFGLRSADPFDLLHGSAPYAVAGGGGNSVPFGFTQGLNDFNANPTISDHTSGGGSLSPTELHLGVAAAYALLAAAGISNSGSSVITGGNVGSFPTTTITPGPWTIVPPGEIDNADAAAAQAAALVAYNFFSALTPTQSGLANLSTNNGGGGAGVYHAGVFSGGALDIPTSITLDAQGVANAQFVFISASTTVLESGASIILLNGAKAANVVWIVGSSFTQVGGANTMQGNILANTSITLGGGTLNGRALAGIVTSSGAITIATAENITVSSGAGGGNQWILMAQINMMDSDYTSASSSKWSLDGYYPSIYVWVAENAIAGTYAVNLNSTYQNGITPPQDLAAGKPIFDGGVNFQVFSFTGMVGITPDGSAVTPNPSTGGAIANPAVAPAIVTTGTGDLVIAVGLQKSANGIGLGPTDGTLSSQYSRITDGKLVGSEAHYIVEWGVQTAAGSWTPKFANPLGYETIIAAVALKHS